MLSLLKWICRDRSGTAGIEFAVTAPVIVLLFVGGVTVFDIFRSYQKIVEANSIVADLISRQTSIDKPFFDNVYGVFTNLQTNSVAPKALRVTSVVRNGNLYAAAWTRTAGETSLLPVQNLNAATLPNFSSGDSLIFVEGSTQVGTMFTILGFGTVTFQEHTFTRPRFIGSVTYTGT